MIACGDAEADQSRKVIACGDAAVDYSRQVIGCGDAEAGWSRKVIGFADVEASCFRKVTGYRECVRRHFRMKLSLSLHHLAARNFERTSVRSRSFRRLNRAFSVLRRTKSGTAVSNESVEERDNTRNASMPQEGKAQSRQA